MRSERGREDGEDRNDRNAEEGTCPCRKRGGGIPTRSARANREWGKGGGAADPGCQRNKVRRAMRIALRTARRTKPAK